MLLGDLRAERRPLLPGRRHLVAELVHQLLVDVEHFLGEVVLQADETAVDRALRERRRRPALEERRREDALQVHGEVERRLCHPDRVVRLLGEDDVRPAIAGAVPQLDLRLHRRRAVAVAVVGDDVHVHVPVGLRVQLRHRQPDGVDPDGDRAGRRARRCSPRRLKPQTSAAATTATSGTSASHGRLTFMCAPFRAVPWLTPSAICARRDAVLVRRSPAARCRAPSGRGRGRPGRRAVRASPGST